MTHSEPPLTFLSRDCKGAVKSLPQQPARIATAMALLFLLREIRYPPLAAAAQVQGDVRLRSGPEGVVLISGPPLLVQEAMVSLKSFGKLSERSETEVVFHFSLIEPSVHEVTVTVKKGNAFDRLFLRVLGFKTEKTIKERECFASPEPPENRIDSTSAPIDIWV